MASRVLRQKYTPAKVGTQAPKKSNAVKTGSDKKGDKAVK